MTKIYCLWLLLVFGEGSPMINELLQRFGSPEGVYKAFSDNIAAVGADNMRKAAKVTLADAEKLLAEISAKRIKMITYDSPLCPKALKDAENPPCALFVRGRHDILESSLVTVVGSRAITPDTYRTQSAVCAELMTRFTPVTTLSEGCDTLTCMTAISRHTPCVVVMPCGHDHIYPKDAFVLREEVIRAGGCVITEYLPRTATNQGAFKRRGRILGGISKAAIIVQAGKGSGALLTASYSPAPFFLPPPDIFNKSYAGTVGAVREGGRLYFDISDIDNAFSGKLPPIKLSPPRARNAPEKEEAPAKAPEKTEAPASEAADTVIDEKPSAREVPLPDSFETDEHRAAYSAVAESASPLTFDEIMYKSGLGLDRLCEVLLDLEIDGLIEVTAGSRYRLP